MALWFFPALTFCLGSWQVYRYKWKQGLLQERKEARMAPPEPFPEQPSQEYLDEVTPNSNKPNPNCLIGLSLLFSLLFFFFFQMEFRRVLVRGSFMHDREIILGPRTYDGDAG